MLGPEARRWVYHSIRGRRDLLERYGVSGVPAWQRRSLPLTFPLISRVIDRALDISDETASASLRSVRACFDRVAERLADGRPYLVGDCFSAADLTFAALAAIVVAPPEYGVRLPPDDEAPQAMRPVVEELRAHPAGRFALELYRTHRRPSA